MLLAASMHCSRLSTGTCWLQQAAYSVMQAAAVKAQPNRKPPAGGAAPCQPRHAPAPAAAAAAAVAAAAAAPRPENAKHAVGKKKKRGSGSIALDKPVRKRQPPPRWGGVGWGGPSCMHLPACTCTPSDDHNNESNNLTALESTSHYNKVMTVTMTGKAQVLSVQMVTMTTVSSSQRVL